MEDCDPCEKGRKKQGEPYNCTSLKPEEFPGLSIQRGNPRSPLFSPSAETEFGV